MPFRYVLTNMAGTALGELGNVKGGRVGHAFNGRPNTGAATVRLDDPLADAIIGGDVLLKAYDGTTLRFVGHLDTFEEAGGGDQGVGSIATAWADPWWVLARRLIGKTATGYTDGTVLAPKDKTTLVAGILAAANADGHTGIAAGTLTNAGVTGYVAFPPYKDASAAILELGVGQIDGPEVVLRAAEPGAAVSGVPTIATMDVAPAIGAARPAAVFEYGTSRRNVNGYRRAGANTARAHRIYGLPSTFEPGATVVVAPTAAPASRPAGAPLLEAAGTSAVTTVALRQALVDEQARLRQVPRTLITFTPIRDDPERPGRVPRYGTPAAVAAGDADYTLGDAVTFRAVEPATGSVRVNAALRVYGIEWSTDEDPAVPTVTLVAD